MCSELAIESDANPCLWLGYTGGEVFGYRVRRWYLDQDSEIVNLTDDDDFPIRRRCDRSLTQIPATR